MKKLVIFLFALLLALSLAGCEQGEHAPAEQNPAPANTPIAFSDDFGSDISLVPVDVAVKREGAAAQLQGAEITPQQALDAALLHAGFFPADVRDTGIEPEAVGCSVYYGVSFEHGGFEYDYFVHPYTGEAYFEEKTPG